MECGVVRIGNMNLEKERYQKIILEAFEMWIWRRM